MSALRLRVTPERLRFVTFLIGAYAVGYLNFKYLFAHGVWFELLVRLPQAYILGFIYQKWVKRSVMQTTMDKWRIPKFGHYIAYFIGLVALIVTIVIGHLEHRLVKASTVSKVTMSQLHGVFKGLASVHISLQTEMLMGICIFFVLYFFIQTAVYLRLTQVWFFNNRRHLFPLVMCLEELFFITVITLLY